MDFAFGLCRDARSVFENTVEKLLLPLCLSSGPWGLERYPKNLVPPPDAECFFELCPFPS